MTKKKRKPSAGARRRPGGAAGPTDPQAVQRGAQALFFVAIAFVAGHQGIVAFADPARTYALWALAIVGALLGLMRRTDAKMTDDLCLSLSARARSGVLFAIVACAGLAISGAGNRDHGLFATTTAEAALVGCLVFAAAVLTWGGAASAVYSLLGSSLPSVLVGAIMFTMAFFSGNLYADAAVFVAAIAATFTTQRTRSIGFAAIVFAYGAGGVPAAVATSALYVAISAARLR
jgi:hypothetical protein